MPFDLSLPIYAAASVGLVAAAHFFARPHIRLRTYNKVHGGLRVVEIALILSRPARAAAVGNNRHATEFVIYMTLKTGSL